MKKILLILICAFVLFFINLRCSGFGLNKSSVRAYSPVSLSKELKERIDREVSSLEEPQAVIRYSCRLTAELLSFSQKNDISNGKANCVGYARLSSTICNYALEQKSIQGADGSINKIKAFPVVGTVHFAGINLNKLSQKILPHKHRSFFKDHDFMEVDLGDYSIFVDACLYDLFGTNNL